MKIDNPETPQAPDRNDDRWAELRSLANLGLQAEALPAAGPPQKELNPEGRQPGISEERISLARQLEELIAKDPRERGALKRAAATVYKDTSLEAYERARKALSAYRKWKSKNCDEN